MPVLKYFLRSSVLVCSHLLSCAPPSSLQAAERRVRTEVEMDELAQLELERLGYVEDTRLQQQIYEDELVGMAKLAQAHLAEAADERAAASSSVPEASSEVHSRSIREEYLESLKESAQEVLRKHDDVRRG